MTVTANGSSSSSKVKPATACPASCHAVMRLSRSVWTMPGRARPSATSSTASAKHSIVTLFCFLRIAESAASLATLARSAPDIPGVRAAMVARFTSLASFLFRTCFSKMASRPARSGTGTSMRRSRRPGRSTAGSRTSGRFVAAMVITSDAANPSNSVSSAMSVFSCSAPAPGLRPPSAPRRRATASISSMNTIARL